MTYQEFAKVAITLKAVYASPNFLPDEASIRVWYELLRDIPYPAASEAAGWTVKALADEFHCTETTVAETMEKEGIA